MSSIPPVTPPPPMPGPPPPQLHAQSRGCGRRALVGCGVAALVVAALCLALVLYIRQKPEVITDFVMRQVESHFASDVTQADKDELKAAYAEFRGGLKDRRESRDRLDRWRATVVTGGPRNEFNHEQVREMIRLFRERGSSAPSSPAVEITEPAPAVTPRPAP